MAAILSLTLFCILRFLPAFLTLLQLLRRKCPLRFLLFQRCKLVFHLDDQHLKLLLALLTGVGIDIAATSNAFMMNIRFLNLSWIFLLPSSRILQGKLCFSLPQLKK